MNSMEFLRALEQLDDRHLALADEMNKENNMTKRPRRFIRTLLIAAVIAALFCGTAVAAGNLINNEDQAWEVVQQEIKTMQEMGLLSQELTLADAPERIFALEENTGDDYWFGRIWKHRYNVGIYGPKTYDEAGWMKESKYYLNLDVDTASGKITRLSIEADGDPETDTPTGNTMEINGVVYDYYRNYDDIFPVDVTVDEYCSRLAEYWGFTGYTLAGTQDDFYKYDTAAPEGSMTMMDVPEDVYLTVYFEGDQEGTPMYIQKTQFPGRVAFMLGTNHMVG